MAGLAVVFYDEPLDPNTMVTFVLIWVALIIFTVDRIRRTPAV